jgi:hypothetical protein
LIPHAVNRDSTDDPGGTLTIGDFRTR